MRIIILLSAIFLFSCSKSNYDEFEKNGVKCIVNRQVSDSIFSIKLNKLFTTEEQSGFCDFATFENKIFVQDKIGISILDKSGKLLNKFSGRGMGPGEFIHQGGLFFIDDTLYVNDGAQKRVSVFDKNGKFCYMITNNNSLYLLEPCVFKDKIIFNGATETKESQYTAMLIRTDKKLKIEKQDTIISAKYDNKRDCYNDFLVHKAVSKHNYYMSKNSIDTYEIDVYNQDHKNTQKISKSYRKQLLSKKDIDYLTKKNGGVTPTNAKYQKAINGLLVDKHDRLWVLAGRENKVDDKSIYFDIFQNGILLNSIAIELPGEFENSFDLRNVFKMSGDYIFLYNSNSGKYEVYDYN